VASDCCPEAAEPKKWGGDTAEGRVEMYWQKYVQSEGFGTLRHSAATLLLAMGAHVKVVQELLGHSNITMTLNIYSHVLPSLEQDAMNKISDLFNQDNNEGDQGDPVDGDKQAR
jgi:integrase